MWTRRSNCPRAARCSKATDRWRFARSIRSNDGGLTANVPQLVDHLFRREAGKMVAYLTKIFGLARLDLAEDVVQDTLCRALESWSLHGLPDNPSAWLMRVARNRAIDLVRRDRQFHILAPEFAHLLELRDDQRDDAPAFAAEIRDDELRMMFSCCHPDLTVEAQVTLILKTLCGFSVSEIAQAFLATEESIEKRLSRARNLFRRSGEFVEIGDAAEVRARLEAVYQAIYLLFNEGYHGSHPEQTVREDLCSEALRLMLLLSEHPEGGRPKTYALLALFFFQVARLPTRMQDDGALIQLEIQDRSQWNAELIATGFHYLDRSAAGNELSPYHVEAAIASLHCAAPTYEETDWSAIVDLYDTLYRLKPSPIVALNRAIAVGKARGPEAGLIELERIPDAAALDDYPFYPAARGELLLLAGRPADAARYFERAKALARSRSETQYFESKLGSVRVQAARAVPNHH
ncbi:MAG: RNA polymerase sigma factor [Sulfurifustis sp.]